MKNSVGEPRSSVYCYFCKSLNSAYTGAQVKRLGRKIVYGQVECAVCGTQSKRPVLSSARRMQILRLDNFQCVYCGVFLASRYLQVDHIKPVRFGGGNEDENLVACCPRCNSNRKNKADAFHPKFGRFGNEQLLQKRVSSTEKPRQQGIYRWTAFGMSGIVEIRPIENGSLENFEVYSLTGQPCGALIDTRWSGLEWENMNVR